MSAFCSICAELMRDDIAALPCGHVFHRECILAWFRQQQTNSPGIIPWCALCKVPARSNEVITLSFRPMHAIKQYIAQLEEEEETNRRQQEEQQEQQRLIQQQQQLQQQPPSNASWAQDDVSMDAADAHPAAAAGFAAAGRDSPALPCPAEAAAAADATAAASTAVAPPPAAVPAAPVSQLYTNATFFRMKLSALQDELEAAESLNERTLVPRYQELMQKFADKTSELEAVQADLSESTKRRREKCAERNAALALLKERQSRLDVLVRARALLHKHRTVWQLVQIMGEKEAAAVLAVGKEARAAAKAYAQGGVGGGTVAAPLSLSDRLSQGVHQFDPEKHEVFLKALDHIDRTAPDTATAQQYKGELRLHLLQLYAAFLRARLATADAATNTRKSAFDSASRSAYKRQIARSEAALAASMKRIEARSEEVVDLEYKLAALQQKVRGGGGGGAAAAATSAPVIIGSKRSIAAAAWAAPDTAASSAATKRSNPTSSSSLPRKRLAAAIDASAAAPHVATSAATRSPPLLSRSGVPSGDLQAATPVTVLPTRVTVLPTRDPIPYAPPASESSLAAAASLAPRGGVTLISDSEDNDSDGALEAMLMEMADE